MTRNAWIQLGLLYCISGIVAITSDVQAEESSSVSASLADSGRMTVSTNMEAWDETASLPVLDEDELTVDWGEDGAVDKPPLKYEEYWLHERPYRYARADVLMWHRVGTGCDRVLVVDQDVPVPGQDTLLSTGDLSFRYEPGVRLTLGTQRESCGGWRWCDALEATYLGVFDWNASGSVFGDNNLAASGVLGFIGNNYSGGDEFHADYQAELHSIELNCVKSCCLDCCRQIDFLCGFRFMTLQEDFALTAVDFQEGTSAYTVSTENHLFGLQMGGRFRRHLGLWAAEFRGTAGLFVNDARQRQQIRDYPDDFLLRGPTRGSGQSAAMLGELSVTLTRHLTDRWSLRGGYDALGVGGLALAPDQLDFNFDPDAGTGLHRSGWVFMHGAHAGLEARW